MLRRFTFASTPAGIKWSVGATGTRTCPRCLRYTAQGEGEIRTRKSTLHLTGRRSLACLFRLVCLPPDVAQAPNLEPHLRPLSAFCHRLRFGPLVSSPSVFAGYFYPSSLQLSSSNGAKTFNFENIVALSRRKSSIMDTPSSESAIPATNDNDDENHANSQKEWHADKPQVAHTMRAVAQTPCARTSIRLPLRRSPSPIADSRIALWKMEKRAFKGTITRERVGASETAQAAQRSPLMVDGQPQFVFFCDGSGAYRASKMTVEDGGYAVVFRDPYGADKEASASDSNSITADFGGPREEDGINVSDFTIRHWYSHRTLGSGHVETAAISQALDEVVRRVDQHRPARSIVKIFSDSDSALERIERGILVFETTTDANSPKQKRTPTTKKERANTSFFAEHTNPFVRAIVWQSHYLSDRGCTIELNWMPRNTTLGHALADHAAGRWRRQDPGDGFNQKYMPHDQRDGILDKLHEEVSAIVCERILSSLPDSESDEEPESEKKPEPQLQPPKKRKKIRGAIPPKEKKAQTQQAEADGFLNNEDHDFDLDTDNMPLYPHHHLHNSHDPDLGHEDPGCLPSVSKRRLPMEVGLHRSAFTVDTQAILGRYPFPDIVPLAHY